MTEEEKGTLFLEENDTTDWRVGRDHFKEKLLHLYQTGLYSDIKIRIKHQEDGNEKTETLNGHSWILRMLSPVFDGMLSGNFQEIDDIVIEDVELDIFKLFFQWIYDEGMIPNSTPEAWKLYGLADKYLIIPFKKKCITYIEKNLNVHSACHNYNYAELYGLDSIKNANYKIIVQELHKVFEEPSFLELSEKAVSSILDEQYLIPPEYLIFNKLECWIDAQVNQKGKTEEEKRFLKRDFVDALIPKIRFMEMSHFEFAREASKSLLLTSEQKLAIILSISLNDPLRLPFGITHFPTKRLRVINCHSCSGGSACTWRAYFLDFSSSAIEFKGRKSILLTRNISFGTYGTSLSFNFRLRSQSVHQNLTMLSSKSADNSFYLNINVVTGVVVIEFILYSYHYGSYSDAIKFNGKVVNDGKPHRVVINFPTSGSTSFKLDTSEGFSQNGAHYLYNSALSNISFGSPNNPDDFTWCLTSLNVNGSLVELKNNHASAKEIHPCLCDE